MLQPVRILIADDHPVFRLGLISVLRNQDEFTVVGEATDGRQALEMIQDLHPDVLLLDLVMPELTGLDTLRELSSSSTPSARFSSLPPSKKSKLSRRFNSAQKGLF